MVLRNCATRTILRFHRDDRGNLGVLLLLTIMALVALIGMVWNTGEYAAKRRNAQTAADSLAHAGNLWTGRTSNLTASTNLVISQNGSAEVILRSIEPTRRDLQTRFDGERKIAEMLYWGQRKGEPEQTYTDTEYANELLGAADFAGNGRGDKRMKDLAALAPDVRAALEKIVPLLPPQAQARVRREVEDRLRRNEVALGFTNNTWVGGAAPAVASHPQPSGGGLRQSVGGWVNGQVVPRLQDILQTLDREQAILDRWVAQTAPALAAATPESLQQTRYEIHEYQQTIRQLTPAVVDEQRRSLETFYKVDLTTATPRRGTPIIEPAAVMAPVAGAGEVDSSSHVDSIRQRYPEAAFNRFGTPDPNVTLDPINVNVEQAALWHPGVGVDAPRGIMLMGQEFSGRFGVGGGEFGRVPCAPLSRYFNDRVRRDREGLRTEPQQIDQEREALRGRVHPPPVPPAIEDLPRNIDDSEAGSPPIPLPPEQIPALQTPQGLTDADRAAIEALNERIRQFNRDVRAYENEIRQLGRITDRMHQMLESLTNTASQTFADQTYLNHVESNRNAVLLQMGWDRSFMVLSTYKLRPIPEWAVDSMRDDAQQQTYREIVNRNMRQVTEQARRRLEQWAYQVLYGNYMQQAQQAGQPTNNLAARARNDARSFANRYAGPMARDMLQRAADSISREVAHEWVARPWPYEIEPPDERVPPHKGLSDDDRKEYFTFVAAARTTDQSAPRPVLERLLGDPDGAAPLVAFAQGESFNWMEFHEQYGAGDAIDRVTEYGHGDRGGSPRPWRLSTTGGWHWQPRLAFSDALDEAMRDNAELRSYMEDAGITSENPDAIRTLTHH